MKICSHSSLKSGSRLCLLATVSMMVLLALCGVCSADVLQNEYAGLDVSSTILIKIDINQSSITDIADSADIIYDYGPLMPGCYAIRTPAGYTRDEAIAYYSSLPCVIFAEPDRVVSVAGSPSPAQTTSSQSPFPVAGLLAGLGVVAGVLSWVRKL